MASKGNGNAKEPKQQSKAPQFKTITPLIRFFVGLELRVELKNGKSYNGFLHEGDDDMNLVLTTSRVTDGDDVVIDTEINDGDQNDNIDRGEYNNEISTSLGEFQFSKLHIRGSQIRYIQFPDNADLSALIKLGLDRKRAAHDKYARGKRQKR